MKVKSVLKAQIVGGKAILGSEVQSDRGLEKMILLGLPYQTVEAVMKRIYPGEIAKYYELVPRTTLLRREKEGALNLEESQKAERVARVYAMAVDVWGSESKARSFLTKEHPMLENRTPFEASLNAVGARQVEGILGRLQFGISA